MAAAAALRKKLQSTAYIRDYEAELASDVLWQLGVLAVEERDPGAGTEDHLVELGQPGLGDHGI